MTSARSVSGLAFLQSEPPIPGGAARDQGGHDGASTTYPGDRRDDRGGFRLLRRERHNQLLRVRRRANISTYSSQGWTVSDPPQGFEVFGFGTIAAGDPFYTGVDAIYPPFGTAWFVQIHIGTPFVPDGDTVTIAGLGAGRGADVVRARRLLWLLQGPRRDDPGDPGLPRHDDGSGLGPVADARNVAGIRPREAARLPDHVPHGGDNSNDIISARAVDLH